MFDGINLSILIGASLVVLSTLTSLVSQRIGAPLLLLFLGVGLLAGEDGLLGIQFDSGGSAYFIGSLALAIILFDSGFDTSLRSYRLAAAPALTLATVGVVLTAGLVGVAARFLFGLGWLEAMMLGAIVASTDAAAVFFLLRVGGLKMREKVQATLEIESGANDPMAIFLTMMLVELAAARANPEFGLNLNFAAAFVKQIGLGCVFGLIGGFAISALLNRLRNLDAGLFPIAGLASALVVFSLTGLLGGSGFLAAYVAGVVAGNTQVIFAQRLRRFQVGMTWLAQIGMFLTLGLLATPSTFGAVVIPAVALAIFLIVFARPVAVWLCLLPYSFKWRETLFVGWVGLRGAVSILLAILPGLGGVSDGEIFFNIVFIMVLASLLIQGWTLGVAARALNMQAPPEPGLTGRFQLELPDDAELELVGYRIHPESTVARGMRIPRWARPVLIMRGGRSLSIHNAGPLQAHDRVYMFARPRHLQALDGIFANPDEEKSAAPGYDFVVDGHAPLADLVTLYGIPATEKDHETIAHFLESEFSGTPIVGDRLHIGLLDLIVKTLDDEGHITRVGIAIEDGASVKRGVSGRIADQISNAVRQIVKDRDAKRKAKRAAEKREAPPVASPVASPVAPDTGEQA